MEWKLDDLMYLGESAGMTEVFAKQDIPQFGIKKGDQGFRRRPSLIFAVIKSIKGPNGETMVKALDYDPATSNEWWDIAESFVPSN